MFDTTTSTRRLRRGLGTAVVLAAALGGTGTAAPAAHAAGPPVVQRMAQALAAVHSYRATLDSITTGSGAAKGRTSAHIELTVLRHGRVASSYMAITSRTAAGTILHQELAYSGARFCERQDGSPAWQCSAPDADTLSQIYALSPDKMLAQAGLRVGAVPLARRVVRGQICDGYALSTGDMVPGDKNTMWVAAATSLPVQEDLASTLQLGTATEVVRATAVFGRWNDPTLTIPAIPGA